MAFEAVHGGTDAWGVPAHDFSTNRNACGPCPWVLAAVQQASAEQYPDPAYTALRAQLAAWHGVDAQRVLIAGSASEWIFRITAHAARSGAAGVTLPEHHYGDYAQAAAVWQLPVHLRKAPWDKAPAGRQLHWACVPSSPLGRDDDLLAWSAWGDAQDWHVLDCAYRPLVLAPNAAAALPDQVWPDRVWSDQVWQMWTPNKALGMTGIRAAYVIAPSHVTQQELHALRQLAPSWVVGAHGVAMLQAWVQANTQQWLAGSLEQLAAWKAQQLQLCQQLGWAVQPGHLANYVVVQWPVALHGARMHQRLAALRARGIKLRECTSFGLPGHVRMGVLPPASQHALAQAWHELERQEQ